MLRRKKIFISYRRSDTADVAGRLNDWLVRRFGKNNVFQDVNSLAPGQDFEIEIRSIIHKCDHFLPLIGEKWADTPNKTGERRLNSEDDLVRIELETAFQNRLINVVPILVNGAEMPDTKSLPISIREVTKRNAARIRRDPDFLGDVNKLLSQLSKSRRGKNYTTIADQARSQNYIIALGVPGAGATTFQSHITRYLVSESGMNVQLQSSDPEVQRKLTEWKHDWSEGNFPTASTVGDVYELPFSITDLNRPKEVKNLTLVELAGERCVQLANGSTSGVRFLDALLNNPFNRIIFVLMISGTNPGQSDRVFARLLRYLSERFHTNKDIRKRVHFSVFVSNPKGAEQLLANYGPATDRGVFSMGRYLNVFLPEASTELNSRNFESSVGSFDVGEIVYAPDRTPKIAKPSYRHAQQFLDHAWQIF